MSRIDEIKERCESATQGPWFNLDDWLVHTETDIENNGVSNKKVIASTKFVTKVKDAEFIAHARDDIPFLLSEIDRLKNGIECAGKVIPKRNTQRNKPSKPLQSKQH